MGTASARSECIEESFCINDVAPQLTEFSKSPFYTGSALSLISPSSSLDKGQKREGGTDARGALHCKDDDIMVDAVVMVKVLFCMFLRAGFCKKF
jgi:hypothetical protein